MVVHVARANASVPYLGGFPGRSVPRGSSLVRPISTTWRQQGRRLKPLRDWSACFRATYAGTRIEGPASMRARTPLALSPGENDHIAQVAPSSSQADKSTPGVACTATSKPLRCPRSSMASRINSAEAVAVDFDSEHPVVTSSASDRTSRISPGSEPHRDPRTL